MPYKVEVTVAKAADLPAADFNGKSDPYVVLTLGEHTRKSSVVPANLNPTWDQKFWFLTEDPAFAVLDVQVFDHDRFTKDDLIGSTTIALSQFVDDENNAKMRMYDLVVPNFFEKQNRKSVIMLEIQVEKDDE
ncbi:C2 domain-containing protein, partial [Globisporangium splendens]